MYFCQALFKSLSTNRPQRNRLLDQELPLSTAILQLSRGIEPLTSQADLSPLRHYYATYLSSDSVQF